MQAGLPVLATINHGNDLGELIKSEGVGRVCNDNSLDTLKKLAEELAGDCNSGISHFEKCSALSNKLFSTASRAARIPLKIARELDLPWPITTIPFVPNN